MASPVAATLDSPAAQEYVVAVRALCEFTAKAGDLDLRFTPAPTAKQGIEGHALVAARRAADYQREITLSGHWQHLLVRGRADGYDPRQNQLEEIKTHRGDLAAQPANHRHLHWAQLCTYGWLFCQQRGIAEITLALVYFDIGSQQETVLAERHSADALRSQFEARCAMFLAWSRAELDHRTARDRACRALRFPFPQFRGGQRELASAVYRAASGGCCLMAQAPTGIGKTVGTLFPLLKSAPTQALDKIFFLTAKGSGRALALDALTLLAPVGGPLPLRMLELVARDKACEHSDLACHGESCPLARGFYDRLPAARATAVQHGRLDRSNLREIALAHQICPYYLSQELVRWSDVVIGDYNYYFDSSALLHGMMQQNQWRVAILVDEAHNLLERGRKMYSAQLDHHNFTRLRQSAPTFLKRPFARLARHWSALDKQHQQDYQVLDSLPDQLLQALQHAIVDMTEFMSANPTRVDGTLQGFYFEALAFATLAESFGRHSLCDLSQTVRGSQLCVRNVIPAPFLSPRFTASHSTTLFSATLSPWDFYADMLGLPAATPWIEVDSPFAATQLQVQVVPAISTRYQHRHASLTPIADLLAQQFGTRRGNYLAFFSSFEYLHQVADRMAVQHPTVPIWRQERGMSDADRADFLQRFQADGCGIGFAVLGGAFAEGIDLPGDRLIGAFIATLGLPQMNPINAQMMQRMQQQFGRGYDYTYLFPGIQKVVQAAGRVIRTLSDQGVVYLIDDRFLQPQLRTLFPRWWQIDVAPARRIKNAA